MTQTQPTATFETVTPMMAKRWLEKNTKNRSINEDNLNGIIAEMNKENFHLTGESIKIAKDDTLLDGQHRLSAIVKSGRAVKMLVVRNLDNDAFKYIDTGRPRRAADVLAIEGIKNPSKIAATVRFILNFKKGQYVAVAHNKGKRNKERVTNATVSEFVAKNKESLYDSYPYGFNKQNKLISGVTLAAFHYIFKGINDDAADDFCHKLANGADLPQTSPIYLLRAKLLHDVRSTKKMSNLERIALVCKSWNLYRTGKKVTILKWDSTKEAFPKPI